MRPEHRPHRLDVGDEAHEAPRERHRVGAAVPGPFGELSDVAALSRELDPKRDVDGFTETAQDTFHTGAGALESQGPLARFVRVGSGDAQLEHAGAGFLRPAGIGDGRVEIRGDQARDDEGVMLPSAPRSTTSVNVPPISTARE